MKKLRLGIVGTARLGTIIAHAWKDGFLKEYKLVAIAGRDQAKAKALADEVGCPSGGSLDHLLIQRPDYIAEAASIEFVREYAEKILASGINLIVLSIGAFADQAFYERVKETAASHGTRVYIASGAVGGFDILRTISLMGEASVSFETRKGPESLQDTPVFTERLLKEKVPVHVFSGNAGEAIQVFPHKVNVSVAASLASAGPERTSMDIYSVLGMTGDDHKITSQIEGVKAVIDIYSYSGIIAAWSVVAVLQNIVSPIVF